MWEKNEGWLSAQAILSPAADALELLEKGFRHWKFQAFRGTVQFIGNIDTFLTF